MASAKPRAVSEPHRLNPTVAPAMPAQTLRHMPDETPPPAGEFLLYQADDGTTRIECRVEQGTGWLSQSVIANLYQKDVRTINEHLQNIFEDGELDPGATIRKFRIVRQEGTRQVAPRHALPARFRPLIQQP